MAEEREKAVKCLRELRNLLTDDLDLRLPIHDEKFLIRFVRAKNYDAKKAHETVRKYYTLKKSNPKVFKLVYPSFHLVSEILKSNATMKLKGNDREGRPVIAWNTEKWDVEKYTYGDMLAAFFLVIEELLLCSVDAQIKGVVCVATHDTLSLSHIKELTPRRLRTIFGVLQGSYPLKMKKILIIKEPSIVDLVLMAIKPFISTKIKERMKFFGYEFEKLHAEVPVEILPKNYGGNLTEDEAYDEEFKQNIFKRDSYYQELLDYGFGHWDSDEEDTYM